MDPESDPDPHQFADVKPKCTGMEYEPILELFQKFKLFLKAKIWIRIPDEGRHREVHQHEQGQDP